MGLLLAVWLFIPSEDLNSEEMARFGSEAVMKEKKASEDTQQRIETLSKDLRGNNFLTPRRNVQPTGSFQHIRVVKQAERILQEIRLKESEQLRKVSEFLSTCQTINHSTLLVRNRYHILTLRKLLI